MRIGLYIAAVLDIRHSSVVCLTRGNDSAAQAFVLMGLPIAVRRTDGHCCAAFWTFHKLSSLHSSLLAVGFPVIRDKAKVHCARWPRGLSGCSQPLSAFTEVIFRAWGSDLDEASPKLRLSPNREASIRLPR